MIEVRSTTFEDVRLLELLAPPPQRLEVARSHGKSIEQALRDGWEDTLEMWSAFDNSHLLCIFGITPHLLLGLTASPFLVTTGTYGRALLKYTKPVCERWRQTWDLINWVDAEYTQALRWAKWAGFTVYPPEPYGAFGNPFCKIEMKCVNLQP